MTKLRRCEIWQAAMKRAHQRVGPERIRAAVWAVGQTPDAPDKEVVLAALRKKGKTDPRMPANVANANPDAVLGEVARRLSGHQQRAEAARASLAKAEAERGATPVGPQGVSAPARATAVSVPRCVLLNVNTIQTFLDARSAEAGARQAKAKAAKGAGGAGGTGGGAAPQRKRGAAAAADGQPAAKRPQQQAAGCSGAGAAAGGGAGAAGGSRPAAAAGTPAPGGGMRPAPQPGASGAPGAPATSTITPEQLELVVQAARQKLKTAYDTEQARPATPRTPATAVQRGRRARPVGGAGGPVRSHRAAGARAAAPG
jgi:hypothetical protein